MTGIKIEIPGLGDIQIRAVCSDYTGTLSGEGKLSDTRGTASRELRASTKKGQVTLADAIPTTVNHAEFKRPHLGKWG